MIVVGVDTGGTFTDLVLWDALSGRFAVHKLPSTPDDPARAVLEGLAHLAAGEGARVVHGSTVATNALLERKGAVTALVTNLGFEDILAIGRQNRHKLYDLTPATEPDLIPEALRFGAPGRVDSSGREISALTRDQAASIAKAVAASGATSVAVCLLFCFAAPEHEKLLGEELSRAGLAVSLSHEIVPEFREYERAATTAVNAYVAPLMAGYLGRIEAGLGRGQRLRVMQSSGGAISAATAAKEPVRTILSGPAGGAAGALAVGLSAGFPRLISFDMGGTSTDVCLLDSGLPLTSETTAAGLPVRTRAIAIHTVGAGGGSIARLDTGGALGVGPRSAGAVPGPACYGRGMDVTVTDANLVLGRIVPERFLGGRMPLFPERAHAAVSALAEKAGLTPVELAEGVVAVADAGMERAIRRISVEKGHDPRDFALFACGGSGGLHAASLAASLNMRTVIVPRHGGVLSALGMVMADVVKDYSRTVMLCGEDMTPAALTHAFTPLEARAIADLAAEGASPEQMRLSRTLDMRYQGQSFELSGPFSDDPARDFHALHERAYGVCDPGRTVETVTIRLRAWFSPDKPPLEQLRPPRGKGRPPRSEAILARREAVFSGVVHETLIVDRDRLRAGDGLTGPAVIVEAGATTLVPPGVAAVTDAAGNLVMRLDVLPGDTRAA